MVNRQDPPDAVRQQLSALMDGESDAAGWQLASAGWRSGDPTARADWYTYHLIGDALRADDLASSPVHDEAFLHRLRERLADEPVVLAPASAAVLHGSSAPAITVAASRVGRSHWLFAPAAVAAGFVAVAVVLVVSREPSVQPAAAVPQLAVAPVTAELPVTSALIRDAHLDRYLAAHRQVSNGVSVGMPGGVVRSVDTLVLEAK